MEPAEALRTLSSRGLDGSSVNVELPTEVAFGPWTSGIVIEFAGTFPNPPMLVEFTSGNLELGRSVATEKEVFLSDSFDLAEGRLMVGRGISSWRDPDTDVVIEDEFELGVWEGNRFSVFALVDYPGPRNILEVFTECTIVEEPEGVVLAPASSRISPSRWHRPWHMRELVDVGVMRVESRAFAGSDVPRWPGTSVDGGDLYCDGDGDNEWLALVTTSAVVTILPDPEVISGDDRASKQEAILGVVRKVRVAWDLDVPAGRSWTAGSD